MAFLAALNVLIYESTGRDDILIACTMAARTRPEVEGLIGCFRKLMIVRTDLSGRPTFRNLLGRVKDVATGAYLHMDVPQEIVFPEWGGGHSIFAARAPVTLNFMETLGQSPTLTGLALSSVPLPHDQATSFAALTFDIVEQEHEILVRLRSRRGMYSPSTAMRYLEGFHALLRRLVSAPKQRLSSTTRLAHS
jgi:non-ribosomal peptide synthetase component F